MADDSRNFRSYYYDKVGFRGVEEKRSLEHILKDTPVDKNKLAQFCLRFTLPSLYRKYVWKILLGVASIHPKSQQEVKSTRVQQADMLHHSLEVMQKADLSTPLPTRVVMMIFLSFGKLPLYDTPPGQDCLAIAAMFSKLFPPPSIHRVFWMTHNFCKHIKTFEGQFPALAEMTESILKAEDAELHSHLASIDAFPHLPLTSWFRRGFADLLTAPVIERVWDKLIGGSSKILPYVAASLFLTLRRPLLELASGPQVLDFLHRVPEDSLERAVTKCLDLWQLRHVDQRPNRQLFF